MLSPTMDEAGRAKQAILRILNRPKWIRGVGFTVARDTLAPADAPCVNAVLVNVRHRKHIHLARKLLGGDEVLGVPVVYHAVGDIVAQAGAELAIEPSSDSPEKQRARDARDEVRRLLNHPHWSRGAGLSYTTDGYVVRVMVQRPEHVQLARGMTGDRVLGVPVLYEAVGDFTPANPPTEPPPFGAPEGRIGGSYDWYWWNFARPQGMPYDPPDPAETEQRDVDRAMETLAERLGLTRGYFPRWLQGIAAWRAPDGTLGVKVNVVRCTPEVLDALRGTLDATDPPTVLGSPLWMQSTGVLRALQ